MLLGRLTCDRGVVLHFGGKNGRNIAGPATTKTTIRHMTDTGTNLPSTSANHDPTACHFSWAGSDASLPEVFAEARLADPCSVRAAILPERGQLCGNDASRRTLGQ